MGASGRASRTLAISLRLLNKMNGTTGVRRCWRTVRSNSRPSRPGNSRSTIIRSGCFLSACIAACPSAQTLKRASQRTLSSSCDSNSRVHGSASAINTCGATDGFTAVIQELSKAMHCTFRRCQPDYSNVRRFTGGEKKPAEAGFFSITSQFTPIRRSTLR
ncbi:hypothetical protein D9M71_404270 [compost metagenome]